MGQELSVAFLSAFGLCRLVQVARGVGFTSLEAAGKLKCSTVKIMPLRQPLQPLPRGVDGPAQA